MRKVDVIPLAESRGDGLKVRLREVARVVTWEMVADWRGQKSSPAALVELFAGVRRLPASAPAEGRPRPGGSAGNRGCRSRNPSDQERSDAPRLRVHIKQFPDRLARSARPISPIRKMPPPDARVIGPAGRPGPTRQRKAKPPGTSSAIRRANRVCLPLEPCCPEFQFVSIRHSQIALRHCDWQYCLKQHSCGQRLL
jgi:hypothetical protein